MGELYDRDYFERGIATQKSLYTDYRWIPELTIPMAMTLIDLLHLGRDDTILDFGCAKGFLVKALRMLHRKAWGCDISRYAIENSDGVREYLNHTIPSDRFDWIIAKDVLEHIEEGELLPILKELRNHGNQMFAIIPLGENGKFIVPAYHLDRTHKIAENAWWWKEKFAQERWKIEKFRYRIEGIKDNWASYEKGNGFFILG